MKRRLLAAVCVICAYVLNIMVSFSPTASAVYEGEYISYGELVSDKPGNIFFGTEPIGFKIDIKNPNNYTVYGRYSYIITDEAENVIYSYGPSSTSALAAGKKVTRTVTLPPIERYGFYKLKLTEESNNKNSLSGMIPTRFTADFSVCIPLDESNIDQSFGFNQKIVNGGNPDAVTLMKNAGAKWHREDVLWQGVEPYEKGKYIVLDSYRAKLEAMKENGIETVCILTGRNPLYDDYKCPSSDEAIKAYADFCTYVATELHGTVDHYEIWNEWNLKSFNPSLEPPETYAKVLKAAYTAIKAVDPDITVIGCDTAGMPTFWIGTVLYRLNGVKYMDAISVHCYDYTEEDGFPEQQFISEVEDLKATLRLYRVDVPVWLTEIGFSTYDNSEAGFVPGCTEKEQLNAMVMLGAINKAYGLFDKIIQYGLNDRGSDKSSIELNWGVLYDWQSGDLKNGAKPAYLGLAAMNYFIGGNADFIDMSELDDRSYEFKFYNHDLNKNVILAINGGLLNNITKELRPDCTSIDIYDKYGNLTGTVTSDIGEFTVDTYSEPIYIVYGESELSVTKNDAIVTSMSQLTAGDRPKITLSCAETADARKPGLLVAQHEGGVMKSVTLTEVEGKFTNDEFVTEFTVLEGADSIKIAYWDMDKLIPLSKAYVIK